MNSIYKWNTKEEFFSTQLCITERENQIWRHKVDTVAVQYTPHDERGG